MKTKSFVLCPVISLASVLLAHSTQASPLVSIGNNADIFFDGSTTVQWTSNVFRDEDNEQEDLLFILSPGLELNIGRGVSNADLVLRTRYDITRYADNDQINNETAHVSAAGSYNTSRLDLSGRVSFDERKSTTGDGDNLWGVSELIESDVVAARLDAEYRFSPKFSFGSGFKYSDKEYSGIARGFFADRETLSLPFDLFYELTPKVDLIAGYTFTQRDVDNVDGLNNAYEVDQHFYNVGARGELLPKLNGFLRLGYRESERSGAGDDDGMFGADLDLSWNVTPKLVGTLNLSQDYGVGGAGGSTENSSVRVSGVYSIDTNWSASANLGYTVRDYQTGDREDQQYSFGTRLSYVMNEHWRFSGGYSYSENDSNAVNRSYENHSLDLTASLHY